MESGLGSTFEDDFHWQERFRGHFSEIARLVCQVEVAAPEDDWKRNTDFILTMKKASLTISARARRAKYSKLYADTFSIRLRRESGARTEMAKLLDGYGDILIYGFESKPGSDRLYPWLLADLDTLRQYIRDGGRYEPKPNGDGTTAAYFYLADMAPEFIVESEGIPPVNRDDPWHRCPDPKCEGRRVPGFHGDGKFAQPLDDNMRPGDGYWRECMFCGTRWKSGWKAPATRSPNPPTSVMDDQILTVMTTTPEIVLRIATRAGMPVNEVERALYRLAGIRPGQDQAPGTGQVVCHRSRPGMTVMWSLPQSLSGLDQPA